MAILNLKDGVSPTVCGADVQAVINKAVQFLKQKDLLLAFNTCVADCAARRHYRWWWRNTPA